MKDKVLLLIATGLAALALGLALFWHPEPPERPLPVASSPQGGNFTLASAAGPVSLADFRGRVVLLYFGYTYCPDICPTALAAIGEGLRRLAPDELAKVSVLFVSVDPERDDPARLKEYAEFFHPAIVGVTGKLDELSAIARRYGVFYARQESATAGGGYVVDHTADTLVVDPAGRLADRIPHATPPDEVVAAIRKYLKPT